MLVRAGGMIGAMFFKPASRYPADPRAVFILALSVFSGLTTLALGAAPDSLHAVLPSWAVLLWSLSLVLGSAVALGGMAFQSINGIIVEQVGSVTVGVAALFYAGVVLWVAGPVAISSAGIIGAWGIACLFRWVQLQVLINSAYRRQQKQLILERVYAELEARAKREAYQRRKRPGRLQ